MKRNACSFSISGKTATKPQLFPNTRPFSLAAVICSLLLLSASAVPVQAQAQAPQATGTDVHFHKFMPAVPPEQSAIRVTSQIQAPAGISAVAAQQIASLEQDKETRTPAQKKWIQTCSIP